MGNYSGNPTYSESIYQFEVTDVVEGGPDGKDNLPLKELADRTAWLHKTLMGVVGFTYANRIDGALKGLTLDDIAFKQVVINANSELFELSLPSLTSEESGVFCRLIAYNVTKQVTISSASANIAAGKISGSWKSKIFLGDFETVTLIWDGSIWILNECNGNLFEVGSFDYGYSQKPNTVIANGSLLNRSDYPRLWEWVQTVSGLLIPDLTWLSNSFNSRGFFSSGNGTTTFRVPDLRGMFIRGLDLGRGVSFGRTTDQAGGYESDEFKSHNHGLTIPSRDLKNDSSSGPDLTGPDGGASNSRSFQTDSAGGAETRPKNIGLIPLIKV